MAPLVGTEPEWPAVNEVSEEKEKVPCGTFVRMRKTERCFASTRNRESGSQKCMSVGEYIICDRIPPFPP